MTCFPRRRPWLTPTLVVAVHLLAGGVSSADDEVTGGTPAPFCDESRSGAPQHRMHQALIHSPGSFVRWQPVAARLSDMLRQLACGEGGCPTCGHSAASDDDLPQDREGLSPATPFFERFSDRGPAGDEVRKAPKKDAADGLRPGEPAQVILDLRRRLGRDVYHGTDFGGSSETLVQWIRTLDEEDRRQSTSADTCNPPDDLLPDSGSDVATEINVLREAARKLGEAADLLEGQNLFDAADEVRSAAEDLRLQARERVERRYAPAREAR